MSLEVALNNVFAFIGTNYDVPSGNTVNSSFGLGNIENPYKNVSVPTPVKFDCGTQKQVDKYLKISKKPMYPLVWLVYPFKESFSNTNTDYVTCKNVRLMFAINTDYNRSIKNRIDTSKVILDSLVKKWLDLLTASHFTTYISIDNTNPIDKMFLPNYSGENDQEASNAQTDVWDVITIGCDLVLKKQC